MRTESGPTMAPQIMMMMMMNSSSAESSSPSGAGGGGGGEEEERWRHFDNSVNAVSFGFVATAILISMFLVMAIFERFLRPPTSPPSSSSSSSQGIINDQMGRRRSRRGSSSSFAFAAAFDLESQHHPRNFAPKLDYPSSSPKMSIYAEGVSVLMPGNDIPTYIAHPAPAPCPPERILWPPHDHNSFPIAGSTSS